MSYENKIKLLNKARASIKNRPANSGYVDAWPICRAIGFAENGLEDWKDGREIRRYIANSLGHNTYLTDWVRRYRPAIKIDAQSMKEIRLQYIDWMIAEYEKLAKKKK